MSLYGTPNQVTVAITDTATAAATTDLIQATITAAKTLTLPAASSGYSGLVRANRTGGQGILHVLNVGTSTGVLTVAAASGDSIASGCPTTVTPGQQIRYESDGVSVWTAFAENYGTGGITVVQRTCPVTAFTDGGGASGTLDLGLTVPAGALYLQTLSSGLTGFAGDTTAVATLGDGSDADRYNTGTPNFFTTAAAGVAMGAPSGTAFHATAVSTVVLTVTTSSDFTLCKSNGAGSVKITMAWWTPFTV